MFFCPTCTSWPSKLDFQLLPICHIVPGEGKECSKTTNPCKGWHLFYICRSWLGLHLITHSFWTTHDFLDQTTPENSAKPWIFCGFSTLPFPHPAAEAGLHMLALYHQHNGSLLLMWKQWNKSLYYSSTTYCRAVHVALGNYLKGVTIIPLHMKAEDLSYQKPVLVRVFSWISLKMKTFCGDTFLKASGKMVIVYKWQKT